MPLSNAPIQQEVNDGGIFNSLWVRWLSILVEKVNRPVLPFYTVATLPAKAEVGSIVFVSNEVGGAVPAFFDGTDWRRVTDRVVVS